MVLTLASPTAAARPGWFAFHFYLPYYLAYDHRQAGSINAYSDLIFDLELVNIKATTHVTSDPKKWYQKIFSCRSKQS